MSSSESSLLSAVRRRLIFCASAEEVRSGTQSGEGERKKKEKFRGGGTLLFFSTKINPRNHNKNYRVRVRESRTPWEISRKTLLTGRKAKEHPTDHYSR